MSAFQSLKSVLVQLTGLSKDTLHVYVGLGVLFAAAAASRAQIGRLAPLVAVLLVAALGEALDMRDDLRAHNAWRWFDALHDLFNTMFWPVVITFLARTGIFRER